jgi:hypothetical protein
MHRTQRLATTTALPTARSGTASWKRNDHAHEISPSCECSAYAMGHLERRVAYMPLAGIIGR